MRTSPRKARLVVEHIRGRSVPEARTVLAFTTRAAARDVEKVLRSAIANAEANHGLVGDDLYVSAAYVDEGPTLKRWRARARGRAARIHKPTCHITVKLAPLAVAREAGPAAGRSRPEPSDAGGEAGHASRGRRRPKATTKPKRARQPTQEDRETEAERANGPESPSRRPPGRHHPRLEVELVHVEQGVRRRAARGREDPRAHLRQARPRGPVGHPDPQGQAARDHRRLHRAPGHRHRQVGRGGGRAAPRDPRHDAEERPDQHQRDQAARARREARRTVDRRAAREPSQLPACDEALPGVGHALWRSRRQGAVRRPARRHRDVPLGEVLGGARAAAHATRRHRLRVRRGEDDLRPHRREGLDQQGRDHARGLRGRDRRARGTALRAGSGSPPRDAPGGSGQREGRRGPDREGLGPVRRRRPERGRGRKRREEPEASTEAPEETTEPTAEAEPVAEADAPRPSPRSARPTPRPRGGAETEEATE